MFASGGGAPGGLVTGCFPVSSVIIAARALLSLAILLLDSDECDGIHARIAFEQNSVNGCLVVRQIFLYQHSWYKPSALVSSSQTGPCR